MFKVGEYCEEEAKYVASYLKDAGLKVDIKGLVTFQSELVTSLQGRASELREKGRISEKQESLIAAIKVALEKASEEKASEEKASEEKDIRDLFMAELDPDWKSKEERIMRLNLEEIDEGAEEELLSSMAFFIMAAHFVSSFLDLNDIKLGEPMERQLEDPMVCIYVDPEDVDPEEPLLRERLEVGLNKIYEVCIDESTSALFEDIDEGFQEEYFEEYMVLMALGLLVEELVEHPEKGRIDIEGFAERCILEAGERFTLSINASQAAEEIARSLEKKGILKMKGNSIKWKT
ncbi:MAG: hypothetical protein WAV83_03670 [Methanothrix sp.]|uniref:hypothetical protein n=1 Tax=Methanothrix sp. TaxID=90426 RepID=UPI003BAF88BE